MSLHTLSFSVCSVGKNKSSDEMCYTLLRSNKGSDLTLLVHPISYCSWFFFCSADHTEFQCPQCGEEQVQWWGDEITMGDKFLELFLHSAGVILTSVQDTKMK